MQFFTGHQAIYDKNQWVTCNRVILWARVHQNPWNLAIWFIIQYHNQARPFQNFWALVARAVYAKEWEAKNEAELCGRIKRKLKEIDITFGQTMMRDVRTQLRNIADNGPLVVMWNVWYVRQWVACLNLTYVLHWYQMNCKDPNSNSFAVFEVEV
jgi:hypothetical protein